MRLDLEELRAANAQRQREWDPTDSITIEYRGNELAGEVGEALNVVKKLARERLGLRGSRATPGQLAEELADVQICLDLLAMKAGVDLAAATIKKFNATSEKLGLATRLFDPDTQGAPCVHCGLPHDELDDKCPWRAGGATLP